MYIQNVELIMHLRVKLINRSKTKRNWIRDQHPRGKTYSAHTEADHAMKYSYSRSFQLYSVPISREPDLAIYTLFRTYAYIYIQIHRRRRSCYILIHDVHIRDYECGGFSFFYFSLLEGLSGMSIDAINQHTLKIILSHFTVYCRPFRRGETAPFYNAFIYLFYVQELICYTQCFFPPPISFYRQRRPSKARNTQARSFVDVRRTRYRFAENKNSLCAKV